MGKHPQISVVIPAFNEEGSVETAIKSIQHQTIDPDSVEIIVVDNNSTDRTVQCARRSGADLIVHERRQGTNAARNRGLECSSGRYVAFLDADCEAPPDWLRLIAERLERGRYVAVSGPCDYRFSGLKRVMMIVYTRYIFRAIGPILGLVLRRNVTVIMGSNFALNRERIAKFGPLPFVEFYGDDTAISVWAAQGGGEVLYDPALWVYASSRRFEAVGVFRLSLRYASHYFRVALAARPRKTRANDFVRRLRRK